MAEEFTSFAAIRASVCDAARIEFGYAAGSREDRVAQLTCDVAGRIHRPAIAANARHMGWDARQFRREKKTAHRKFRRTVRAGVVDAINADPAAYGFGPVAIWFLWTIIGGIVSAIVQRLFDAWWDGRLFSSQCVENAAVDRLTRDNGSD